MNEQPPTHGTLRFKMEAGDPVVLRFEYKGAKYTMRIVQGVFAVWPTGQMGADGNPTFHAQVQPQVVVSKDTAS